MIWWQSRQTNQQHTDLGIYYRLDTLGFAAKYRVSKEGNAFNSFPMFYYGVLLGAQIKNLSLLTFHVTGQVGSDVGMAEFTTKRPNSKLVVSSYVNCGRPSEEKLGRVNCQVFVFINRNFVKSNSRHLNAASLIMF